MFPNQIYPEFQSSNEEKTANISFTQTIIRRIIMNRIIFFTLIVFLLTSCGTLPDIAPRKPVALADLQKAEAEFRTIANTNAEAWNARDANALRALFSDDADVRDRTYGDHYVGNNAGVEMAAIINAYFPSWKTKVTGLFIGKGEGLSVDPLWNVNLGYSFTEDDPMIEVDWFKIRDAQITVWNLFYSLDSLEKTGHAATTQDLEQARALLSSYQSAWASGDQKKVVNLYTKDAIREDSIFGEQSVGSEAIQSSAEAFFAWYPGAQWTLSLGFGEGQTRQPLIGGVFIIKIKDSGGQPCEVRAAALLQTSQYKITHESLFYEPQTLINCGWAK
jgi:ketosteroid isomerase-like protein